MKGARLEVSDPLGRTHILPFEDDRFTIGCRHGNTLSLGSPEFSRLHSEIIKEGEDSYILRDLGTRVELRQPPPGPFRPRLWPGLAEALVKADCFSVEYCRYSSSSPLARQAHRESRCDAGRLTTNG